MTFPPKAASSGGEGHVPMIAGNHLPFSRTARRCRQVGRFVLQLLLTVCAFSVTAHAEPVDEVLEFCTQTSSSYDGVEAAFKKNDWSEVMKSDADTIGRSLAVATIGMNVTSKSPIVVWKSRMELRTMAAAALVRKPDADFYRSALLEKVGLEGKELALVMWSKSLQGVTQIQCQFSGQRLNNSELVDWVEKQALEFSIGNQDIQYFPQRQTSSLMGARSAQTSLTVLNRAKVEQRLGYSLTADVGLKTTLNMRP